VNRLDAVLLYESEQVRLGKANGTAKF